MTRAVLALAALGTCLLAACTTAPAPAGRHLSRELPAQVLVGQSTRASLLAQWGPTRQVVFDSGFETWLYQVPVAPGQVSEFVVLIGPDGVVRKTRLRAPEPVQTK